MAGLVALSNGPASAQAGSSDVARNGDLSRAGNVVDAGPATGVITLANPTVHVPIRITRDDSIPTVMAFSVTFTISPILDLPSGMASITEGDYLRSGGGLTTFLTVDLGGGQFKADGATLGLPCGTTSLTGTLFGIELTSTAMGGIGTITIDSVTLRDCTNQDVSVSIGTAAEVTVDRSAPVVTVTSPNGGEVWHVGSTQNTTWTVTDPEGVASIDVAYSTTGGAPYTTIATGLPGSQTSYAWTIPATPSTTVKVLVSARDLHANPGEDPSDGDFEIAYYRIQALAAPGGSIDPAGTIEVPYDASRTFTIIPDPCYHIADVLVDGVSVGPVPTYSFTHVQDDHVIRAFFAIDTFTISADSGPHGLITPSEEVVVDCGGGQEFTIVADLGYHVADVVVDGESVGPMTSYTFTNVTADHTIHASFAIDTFTILATAGDHGSIDPSGAVAVEYGADQSFTIAPAPGYHVADVIVDGGSVGAVTAYTFYGVTAGHTIHAAFAIDVFTIMATAGPGGAIEPSGAVNVNYGDSQGFTITPDLGHHVSDVLVDGSSVGAVETYTFANVTADHTIHATFAIDVFTITATAGLGGLIDPSGVVTVDYGGSQAFTILPTTGYHVVDVRIDDVSFGAITFYEFTSVTANHTIDAVFAIDTFTIMATAGPGGSIDPSGAVIVEYDGSQGFTILPATGRHILDVLVDGASVGAVGAYTFTNVTADHTIHADFAIDTFTISASAGLGGLIDPSGEVIVEYGADRAFDIVPGTGYHIADVLVDGSSIGSVATYTFTNVTADHTIHATFAIDVFTIAATAGPNGGIDPSGDIPVNYGGSQGFTMVPNAGYHVADVLVDGSSVGAVETYTFTNVTADHSIHATFAVDVFTITATAGPNGLIDPSGSVPVNYGDDQAFTIVANVGFHIDDVLVDGASVGPVGTYTFTGVIADHTIHADFATNPPVAAIVDLVATQIRTGNDAGETTEIRLTWTATPEGTVVEVWRASYGHYPEYDDGGGFAPTFSMTYPPGSGWTLTGISATGETEMPGPRDFYFYVAYVRDGYGTWSPASNGTVGTLNYHLGDVSDGTTPGTGDNRVFGEDISLLGFHYGIDLGMDDPLDYLDVGPTSTMFIDGRPTTDNHVDFEDLVMFAINYDIVSFAKGGSTIPPAGANELILLAPERVEADGTATVRLMARGTGELIALSTRIDWDPAIVEPAEQVAGEWLAQQGGVAFSARPGVVDAAVMNGHGIVGEGSLATLTFRVLAPGEPNFRIASVDGRNHRNQRVEIGVSVRATAPLVTRLESARPNPVRESMTISFILAAPGPAQLSIFAVDGRRIRVLASGFRAAGEYGLVWDGSDDNGRRVAEGIYYAQLVTAQGSHTRKVVLLR
jgi:hypothetical protein